MQIKDQQSAEESYTELLATNSKSVLIDVRSSVEWSDLGVPDFSLIPEKLILCEWRRKPYMELNENFFSELDEQLDFQKVEKLYFMCAAGIRSQEAASYTRKKLEDLRLEIACINVVDGFSGNKNCFFSFDKANGWKDSGLPYCKLKKPTDKNLIKGLK